MAAALKVMLSVVYVKPTQCSPAAEGERGTLLRTSLQLANEAGATVVRLARPGGRRVGCLSR
jgi:K+-sensing histidine kinase KdpD